MATGTPGTLVRNPILERYKALALAAPSGHAVDILRRNRKLGLLVPALRALEDRDLEKLSAWRNLHRTAFFSDREVSAVSTGNWLRAIAAREDRLLFLITTDGSHIVGHIGLNGLDEIQKTAETDAWLGVGDSRVPGIMFCGFATLAKWAFEYLGLDTLSAQVFSDNGNVIRAHTMLGFQVAGQVPVAGISVEARGMRQNGNIPTVRLVTQLRLEKASFYAKADAWR